MSATKNALQDWEDTQQALEQALYEAQVAMNDLTKFCWSNGDCEPFHAPDQQWISYTATQLSELRTWLEEMQTARDAMSVNN